MAKPNMDKYRQMSVDELQGVLNDLETDLFNQRLGNVTKELTDTSLLSQTKREKARVKTVLTQKLKESATA